MKEKSVILFLICSLINLSFEQSDSKSLETIVKFSKQDCNETQYFDSSKLECKNCPKNSISVDKINCICGPNFYYLYNYGGGSIDCAPCENNKTQSSDGFRCVIKSTDQCRNGFLSDFDIQGNPTDSIKCIVCSETTSILLENSCKSCKPYIYSENNTTNISSIPCNFNFSSTSGGLFFLNSFLQEPNDFKPLFDVSISNRPDSWFFKEYAQSTYRTCKSRISRNLTSCLILSNMCVLNLYKSTSSICSSYETLYKNDKQENNNKTDLPWLDYEEENYGKYKENYFNFGIDSKKEYLQLRFSSSCSTNNLKFVSAEYDLNGKLTRFGKFDIAKLQLCNVKTNYAKVSRISPFTTTNLVQKCSIKLEDLFELSDSQPLIFYDLYLEYGDGTNIFPIPIKVSENGQQINRRFFLFETVSSKTQFDKPSEYIRYAKSITIRFELVKGKSNGEIYPPLIKIDYDYAKREDSNKSVHINFNIEYQMEDLGGFFTIMYILIGVMGSLALFWSLLKIWIWNRRSGRFGLDMIALFKFLLFLIGSAANAFFLVIVGTSIYWLIFYRGQNFVLLFLPDSSQEKLFGIFLIVSFVLKFVDVFYLTLVQTSYDIFFVDWEKPKTDKIAEKLSLKNTLNVLPPINDRQNDPVKEQLNEQNKISCWRTLFVANEWNELQTYRKTNVSIQLIFVLFFLKVLNFEVWAFRDCSTSLFRDQNDYQAPYSGVLRIAVGSSIYLAVGLLQLFIFTFIYTRCIEDKIGQFVDFCSVSNISMFIMTHTQFGYYIHGRSPHGFSDTSMMLMTRALAKEENDLTARRGLDQGSNHQTFSISFPSKLSRQYSKLVVPLDQKKPVNRTIRRDELNSSNEFEKKMLAYTQLNRFLISFIDNTLRGMNYSIQKRNFVENILDFEFKEPHSDGYFYEDEMTNFTETIFYGKERTLFIFDLTVFLFFDYFFQNYVLAAFAVYLISKIITVIRSDMGKRNLSRKTLVDKRFLI